jgi:phosphinothricin acetyltransferase
VSGDSAANAVVVRAMREEDWSSVRRIHEEGIATGQATFETAPDVSWGAWDGAHMRPCRLVAECAEDVVGWAALAPVSSRCVYGGVGEVSIYVAAAERGKGIGRMLMERLVEASEQAGLWMLQAGIFPENLASLRLHHACGFREVGRRERLGRLGDAWKDVLLLERRSSIVGV